MKKIALFLALVLTPALAACGDDEGSPPVSEATGGTVPHQSDHSGPPYEEQMPVED